MTITCEDLVRREVHYCVSALVSTLATEFPSDGKSDLAAITEQAFELSTPIDDWEEAAIQAGWTRNRHNGMFVAPVGSVIRMADYESWQELCEENGLEPCEREVYEHWIVSDWLADELEAAGEKVDRDFAGLTVWARTITGQAIAADSVIERIHANLTKGA